MDVVWEYRNRLLIEAVLCDYCRGVDALDHDLIVGLFAEDAEFDFGFGRVHKGPTGVYRQISSNLSGTYSHTSHHISNIQIEFQGRNRATSRCYFMAWHRQLDDGATRRLYGRYFDDLALSDSGWKITRRRLLMAGEEGYPPVPGQPTPFELIERRGRG